MERVLMPPTSVVAGKGAEWGQLSPVHLVPVTAPHGARQPRWRRGRQKPQPVPVEQNCGQSGRKPRLAAALESSPFVKDTEVKPGFPSCMAKKRKI